MSAIQSKAMLARLTISAWSARRYDKQVSDEVARQHGTTSEAGRYNKLLLAKDALADIQRIDGAARTWHYQQTLPWSDEGARILPAASYFEYAEKMRGMRDERARAVEEFTCAYPMLVQDARARLGTLFREEDYPAADVIAGKFSFDVSFLPLPDGGDLRVELADDALQEIREDIEQRTSAAVKDATRDLWQRVHDTVKHMHERLSAYQGKGKGREGAFRDSMVENMRELVQLMPRLNFTGDAELDRMTRKLSQSLCVHDAEDLRTDSALRETVAKQAEKILRNMEGYIGSTA